MYHGGMIRYMYSESAHRRIDEETALRAVVEGTASSTGEDFYRALVENLSRALDTRGAWVTVYDEAVERLRAIAFQFAGQWVDNFEYPIAGTACETAIREKRLVHIPDRVVDLYPAARNSGLAGVVSYLGVPILDDRGTVIGHLAVVDDRPMPDEKRLIALFQIFAARAAAEMRRLHLESALREREEKLRRLIDGAMDAILECDRNLSITMMNPAAERLFGCEAARLRGDRMERLLGDEATSQLGKLARNIESPASGGRHLWLPGPFMVKPTGGTPFYAEATLSCYEALGQSFFTLILRNVEDRVRAERRIASLSAQAEYLRTEIEEDQGFDEIVGKSPALRATLQAVAQVAQTDATVLILGETGTGKELFARAIHKRSLRRDGPLIKVNCAAIPATLIESEFFGHEKGAFTGATQRRDGRFALADGGTIFLDEIGELPLELQGKLLRILQEGEFELVGGSRTHKVDVRVIAATNRDLERAVREGTFREDLYYRLSVFPLRLPPLREREDDVVVIAESFIDKLSRRMGRPVDPLSPAAAASLKSYPWPGNVRELRNVIERALITSGDAPLCLERVLPMPQTSTLNALAASPASSPREILGERQLREIERVNMIAALEQKGWRVGGEDGAAQLLGINPSTFKSRMKALEIKRPG
jgi:PAS domain S-box-containing protein